MAGISKYETFAQQTLGDVYFKPNLDLINQSLAARQGKYDTNLATMKGLKAKIGDVPTIEGYDQDRYHQKVQEYDADIDKLKGLYNGDLSRADNELDDFTRKLSDDFGKHGEFNAMQQNYNAYAANAKSLAERRNKNEISEAQYAELSRRLKAYQPVGIGKDSKNWNSWNTLNLTDRIDKDKFLKDFVAIKEKEKETQGWYRDKNEAGKLIWRKNEHEYIGYDDLLAEGKQALQNKLKETGEIEYEYKYHLDQTGEPSVAAYQTRYQVVADKTNEKLRKISTLSGAELQTELKTLYPDLKVTGLDDATTKQYKEHAIKALTEKANQYQTKLDESKQWNDMTVKGLHRQQWEEDWLSNITHPYAGAKSHDRFDADIKIESDPYLQHSFEMQKIERQGQIQKSMIDYEFNLNQPKVITTGKNTGFVEMPDERGVDMQDWKQKTDALKEAEGMEVENFAGTLFKDMFGQQHGDNVDAATAKGLGAFGYSNPNDLIMDITKQMNGGKSITDIAPSDWFSYKKLDAKALSTAQLDNSGNLVIQGQQIALPKGIKINPNSVKDLAQRADNNLRLQMAQQDRKSAVEGAVLKEMNINKPVEIEIIKNPHYEIDRNPNLSFEEKELVKWNLANQGLGTYSGKVPKNNITQERIQKLVDEYYPSVSRNVQVSKDYNKRVESKFKETGTNRYQSFMSDAPLYESVRPENHAFLKDALSNVAKSGTFNDIPGLVQEEDGAVNTTPKTVMQAAREKYEADGYTVGDVIHNGFMIPDMNVGGQGNSIAMTYTVNLYKDGKKEKSVPYTVYREASKTPIAFQGSENIFTNPAFKAQKELSYLKNRSEAYDQSSVPLRLPNGKSWQMTALKPQRTEATGGVTETGLSKGDKNQSHIFQVLDENGNHKGTLTQAEAYNFMLSNQASMNIKNNLSNPNLNLVINGQSLPAYAVVSNIINKNNLNSESSKDDIINAFAEYPALLNDGAFMNKQFNLHKKGTMNYKEAQAYGLQGAPEENYNNQPNITNIKRTTTYGR